MNYRGQRVTVMGLGRFGGGAGAARFLAERGARVSITDLSPAEKLADSIASLNDLPITAWRLGEHRAEDFQEADLIVASPAVPRENPYLRIAREAGVEITSEMNLFWRHNRGRVIGVTGSNGKSTTTAMIHAILSTAGRPTRLGGNIGRSLLPEVDSITPDEFVVLELSSFQLENLAPLRPQPDVAVVTNFTPNHLDRHGSLAEYRTAKQNITAWQRPDQIAVLDFNDADIAAWPTAARRMDYGTAVNELPLTDWLQVPGPHNLRNAQAAACAALAVGVDVNNIETGLRSFRGLPHRLEVVAELAGRRFVNDSIATTPESVEAALRSFEDARVILLAGGYDKGIDLTGLARLIGERCHAVALIGQTAGRLEELLTGSLLPRQVCASLEEAVRWAYAHSHPGDVVLLSPGCASYDWFRDFEERGRLFAELARECDADHRQAG